MLDFTLRVIVSDYMDINRGNLLFGITVLRICLR